MSKKENKTEDTAEKKPTNTAPYMKKENKNESTAKSNKSNIVMPLVLLLVLGIVIVATFYEDEYKSLLALDNVQNESQDNAANIESVTTDEKTKIATETTAETVAKTLASEIPTGKKTSTASIKVPVTEADANELKNAQIESPVAVSSAKVTAATVSEQSKVSQTQSANSQANTQTANTPYRYNGYNRAQAQAKKYQAFMQQRREAYEKEMQTRRAQYEAAIKEQQEKRAQVIKAQRAVFERTQQKRLENKQKIDQLHEKISQMHKEIHQIINESYAPRGIVSPAPAATTKQMQSI